MATRDQQIEAVVRSAIVELYEIEGMTIYEIITLFTRWSYAIKILNVLKDMGLWKE